MKGIPVASNTNQAIWVAIGQLSSFLLSIVSAAILARYFDKTEYGTYKQVLYIYNTLLILFSAGLHSAYSFFLPKQTMAESKDFVYKMMKMFALLGFGFSITLFLLAPVIANLFNNPELKIGLRLFSVVPILMLPTTGINGVYASIRKTHIIAVSTTVTQALMLALITLPVVLMKGTYTTAIYGWILASFINCAFAIYLILKPFSKISRDLTLFKYKDIFKYSLPLMTATIYGILIKFADQFFISRYYGTEVFAEFSNGFVDLPFVAMVVGAAGTVLLPLFSKDSESLHGKKNICQTWKSSIEKSIILLYPILAFFIFNAKSSVIVLYGKQYAVSASYFKIGMLISFFNVVVYNPVLFAFGKTRLYATIHLVQATLIWITGYIVIYFSDTPLTYAFVSRLFYIGQVCIGIFCAARVIEVRLGDVIPFRIMLKIFIHSSIFCGLVSWLVGKMDISVFLRLGLSGLISAGLVLFTGGLFRIPYLATVKSMLISVPAFSFFQYKWGKSQELN